MTDPRGVDTTPLNPPDRDDLDTLRQLAGEEEPERQDGILETDQIEVDPGVVTDTELYEGELGPMDVVPAVTSVESLELLEDLDLRDDETGDPNIASEEGIPWVPPIDPPVVASDNPEGVEVAAGFAVSALDTPYDLDDHQDVLGSEDEMSNRVREALRADSSTTGYAEVLEIDAEGATVTIRGVVEDLEDEDNIVAVASTVTGIKDVVDELEVAGL